jgi:hypothetical protein
MVKENERVTIQKGLIFNDLLQWKSWNEVETMGGESDSNFAHGWQGKNRGEKKGKKGEKKKERDSRAHPRPKADRGSQGRCTSSERDLLVVTRREPDHYPKRSKEV